jgi:CCR4-NOT complex subunit CAF16
MVPEHAARVLGRAAFHDATLAAEVAFIGGDFPFDVDVTVAEILAHRPAADPTRRERVRALLGVEPGWHMNRVSSGQRRRVQILLHLERPARVVFLDEVTADLDVLARADLLTLLAEDSAGAGTTILYATHVLDGLDAWATHVLLLRAGRIELFAPLHQIDDYAALRTGGVVSPLLRWLEGRLRG